MIRTVLFYSLEATRHESYRISQHWTRYQRNPTRLYINSFFPFDSCVSLLLFLPVRTRKRKRVYRQPLSSFLNQVGPIISYHFLESYRLTETDLLLYINIYYKWRYNICTTRRLSGGLEENQLRACKILYHIVSVTVVEGGHTYKDCACVQARVCISVRIAEWRDKKKKKEGTSRWRWRLHSRTLSHDLKSG